jgi:hypothetical protein
MKKRIAVVAALFTFAFPAVAGATIVVNGGMSGVRLDNTMNQVRHALGRPNEVDHFGGTTAWFYASSGLSIDFGRTNRVHDLSTGGHSELTASGVGVGSSEVAVMRLVPGVHCSPNAPGSQGVDCTVSSAGVLTDFHVTTRRGLVQSVTISREP